MSKRAILILSLFLSTSSFADILVVGGKPYEIKAATLKVCGETGSPEQAAAIFNISIAQSGGEKIYATACQVNGKDCSPQAVKKFGIDQVFQAIRSYPSIYSESNCKELRADCENRCIATKVYSEKTCIIECNQYEIWNR